MLETASFSIRMLKKWLNNSKKLAHNYTRVKKYSQYAYMQRECGRNVLIFTLFKISSLGLS